MNMLGGLDVREYQYSFFAFTSPDAARWILRTFNEWLITRIQCYAGAADPATLEFENNGLATVDVVAGGCLQLEPLGAYRGGVAIRGLGALLVVEFLYQARPTGSPLAPTPAVFP